MAIGCASPGPPRSPSLGIPEPVTDLTAHRVANSVQLQFTVPSRSTDKLPLRGTTVTGWLCRQTEHATCITPAGFPDRIQLPILDLAGRRNSVTWTDALPPDLTSGTPKVLAYRVEFFSAAGNSAGPSEAAYTATGSAPAPVTGLRVSGSRLGVILHWDSQTKTGETLIERETVLKSPPTTTSVSTPPTGRATEPHIRTKAPMSSRASRGTVASADSAWLTSGSLDSSTSLLDTTARLDIPYSYQASRRIVLQLGGRAIEVRSESSAPVTFTLHPIYPPPTPTGLTAAGYTLEPDDSKSDGRHALAIDLIWQPVDVTGLLVPLAGYNVFRQLTGPGGQKIGEMQLQTPTPIPLPAFHDPAAIPKQRYLYSVTAVDARGNQSAPITVVVDPSTAP